MTEENSLAGLLAAYLYVHRYLSLPGIGRFYVAEGIDLSGYEQKKHQLPAGSIQYIKNLKEEADVKLIHFITERTRKMKSLALADLFTLTEQAREMLNIGQPVSFEGIGTLRPTLQGDYEFSPGVYQANLLPGEYEESEQISGYSPKISTIIQEDKIRESGRSFGGTAIILICLAIVGVLVYFMVIHKGEQGSDDEQRVANRESPVADTAIKKSEATGPQVRKGIIHYEVVFERADSQRAFWRYNQLTGWGHRVIMHTTDSIHYILTIPATTPASDTTKMKDSIRILYGHPTSILYVND